MAYTNFTNCTKEQYWNIIYGEDSSNRIRIWFNNVELQDADEYCISLKQKDNILPTDGNKTFTLSNFISKELELVLRDLPEETTIEDQVRISIGTLVDANNNTYEDVPLGVFNIQDTPKTDQNKVTIKLRDNRVKFDFKYNAQPLIESLGGEANLGEILDDICDQASVVNNVGRFDGDDIYTGLYDNTITGTTYVGYIAEQCGMIPKIDRNGALVFVNLIGEPENASITDTATLEDLTSNNINNLELKGNTTQTGTPTPSSPVAVESVTGLQKIITCGTNLFNANAIKETNIVVTDNGASIKMPIATSGNGYRSTNSTLQELCPTLKVGDTVYLYFDKTPANYNQYIYLNDSGYLWNKGTSRTITQTDLTGTVALYGNRYNDGQTEQVTITNFRIVKEANTPYSFYTEQINEINLGKNLLKLNATGGTYNELTLTKIEEGMYRVQGTTTSNARSVNLTNIFPKLEAGQKYTFSLDIIDGNVVGGFPIAIYNADDTVRYNYFNLNSGNLTQTNTIIANHGIHSIVYWIGANSTVDLTFRLQLEKSPVATSYSPYFDPIYLNGISDYKDRIFKSKGKNIANDIFTDYDSSNASYSIYPIKLKQGATYTLKATLVGEKKTNYYNYGIVKDGTNYSTFVDLQTCVDYGTGNTFTKTFTVDSSYTNPKLVCFVQQSETKFNELFTNYQIQLEENTTASSYEPYGTPSWYIEKKIRHLSLAIADMNNSEDYPGWTNQTQLKNDYPAQNTFFDYLCNYKCNIGIQSEHRISINTNGTGVLFLPKSYNNNLTQSQWKTNYPNLKLELYYNIPIPEYTKITNEELIEQLENIRLLTGINNINSSVPLDFVYLKEKEHYRIPLSIVEKYELGTSFDIKRVVYESGIIKYETSDNEELSTLYLNSANPYITTQSQVDTVYDILQTLNIDSVKTGKILGNPAIDSYDIIEVYDEEDENELVVFKTFANNEFNYNGVNIQTFTTQISQEGRKENVTSNSQSTIKKYVDAKIDAVEGTIIMESGRIDELDTQFTKFTEDSASFTFEVNKKIDDQVSTLQSQINGIDTSETQNLKNAMVQIDINGITVSTPNVSKIKTMMKNDSFSIVDSGDITLAYFGYDEITHESVAQMDNLTIDKYFIAGQHRIETFDDDRTGWFYIGGGS